MASIDVIGKVRPIRDNFGIDVVVECRRENSPKVIKTYDELPLRELDVVPRKQVESFIQSYGIAAPETYIETCIAEGWLSYQAKNSSRKKEISRQTFWILKKHLIGIENKELQNLVGLEFKVCDFERSAFVTSLDQRSLYLYVEQGKIRSDIPYDHPSLFRTRTIYLMQFLAEMPLLDGQESTSLNCIQRQKLMNIYGYEGNLALIQETIRTRLDEEAIQRKMRG